jgi:AcrR family transcriptional regulator
VQDAIVDTTTALVAEHGLLSVTMSQIAEETGIGRATLYKYFPDIEAILLAWHERQIATHLDELAAIRDRAGTVTERLISLLEAYASLSYSSRGHHDADLAALLHRNAPVPKARQRVHEMLRNLLAEGAATGDIRDDASADELASFCLHALSAAGGLSSKVAVRRLVAVTMSGLTNRA